MRKSIAFLPLVALALVGCQGVGGYSAQSVTRVPPVGLGSYALPGSAGTYYGNAAPAPGTGAMLQPAALSNQAVASAPQVDVYQRGNFTTSSLQPNGTTAQYDLPSTSPVAGGVVTASADAADLQWQR